MLSPLLTENAKRTPYWKSWVAHVRVLEMALRNSYSLADVATFDELIMKHHKLFIKEARSHLSPAPLT